jgi:hypothetical protein
LLILSVVGSTNWTKMWINSLPGLAQGGSIRGKSNPAWAGFWLDLSALLAYLLDDED